MPDSGPVTVALDVTPLIGFRTGIGVAVAETYDGLRRSDHPPSLVPYALSLRARRSRSDLPPHTVFPPLPARALLAAWQRVDLPRIDRWLRADVVHATNYLAPPSRRPVLISVWDCSFVRHPELTTSEVRALAATLRRALARGAHVHTGAHAIAREIDELFGPGLADAGRIHVVAPGVPTHDSTGSVDSAPAAVRSGRPYVLALGRQEPRKDYPRLVRAFGTVTEEQPEITLLLAGPTGPATPDIEAAVASLPAAARARVHVLGTVSEPEKHALLSSAAVLCLSSRYEGFGFPVLEAMRAGTPVVATATGSIPEVAGDAAELVAADDDTALAGGILRVLQNSEQRDRLIAAGRRRVEDFSWERAAAGLNGIYRQLAA